MQSGSARSNCAPLSVGPGTTVDRPRRRVDRQRRESDRSEVRRSRSRSRRRHRHKADSSASGVAEPVLRSSRRNEGTDNRASPLRHGNDRRSSHRCDASCRSLWPSGHRRKADDIHCSSEFCFQPLHRDHRTIPADWSVDRRRTAVPQQQGVRTMNEPQQGLGSRPGTNTGLTVFASASQDVGRVFLVYAAGTCSRPGPFTAPAPAPVQSRAAPAPVAPHRRRRRYPCFRSTRRCSTPPASCFRLHRARLGRRRHNACWSSIHWWMRCPTRRASPRSRWKKRSRAWCAASIRASTCSRCRAPASARRRSCWSEHSLRST